MTLFYHTECAFVSQLRHDNCFMQISKQLFAETRRGIPEWLACRLMVHMMLVKTKLKLSGGRSHATCGHKKARNEWRA
jgi:hypothetical protein